MVIFSSYIPQLNTFKVRERQQIIAIALSYLTPWKKIFLRVLKLFLLVPLFFILANFEGWVLLPLLLVAGLCYPLLTTPLEISFARPYLDNAIKQYKQGV